MTGLHYGTRAACLLAVCACGESAGSDAEQVWSQRVEAPDAALLSVHGRAADDVWAVGADAGEGPLILHFDGERWQPRQSGAHGDLWWVHASESGPVYFGGSEALVLRYAEGAFTQLSAVAGAVGTVYGMWAAAPDDVYAVGAGERGHDGFLWHDDGRGFRELALPDDVYSDDSDAAPGLFKVWGATPDEVWVVGGEGLVLRGNAREGFLRVPSGTQATLFTVYAAEGKVVMVGGDAGGVLLELEGSRLVDRTPQAAPLLQGVTIDPGGAVWAVGLGGSIYRGEAGVYEGVDPGIDVPAAQALHAAWADPRGRLWSVGGNVFSEALDAGLLLYRGPSPPGEVQTIE